MDSCPTKKMLAHQQQITFFNKKIINYLWINYYPLFTLQCGNLVLQAMQTSKTILNFFVRK